MSGDSWADRNATDNARRRVRVIVRMGRNILDLYNNMQTNIIH
jgi:hypothetical protein